MAEGSVISAATLGHPGSLEELIEAARAGGFAALQMRHAYLLELAGTAGTAGAAAGRLSGAGIGIDQLEAVFGWADSPDDRKAEAEDTELLETAASAGARAVLAGSMRPGASPEDLAPRFARLRERAADLGLECRLEFIPWGSVPDLTAALTILGRSRAANTGLVLDSWHVFRGGTSLEAVARLPGELIRSVQICDRAGDFAAEPSVEESWNGRTWPGEGDLDLAGFLAAVAETGTTAPVSIEISNRIASAEPAVSLACKARSCMDALPGG